MSTKAVFDSSLSGSSTAQAAAASNDPLPAGLTPSLMSVEKPKLTNEHTLDMIDDIFDNMHPAAKKVSNIQKMKEAAKAKLTAKLNEHAQKSAVAAAQAAAWTAPQPAPEPVKAAPQVFAPAIQTSISLVQQQTKSALVKKLQEQAKLKLMQSKIREEQKAVERHMLSSQPIPDVSPKISQIASLDHEMSLLTKP